MATNAIINAKCCNRCQLHFSNRSGQELQRGATDVYIHYSTTLNSQYFIFPNSIVFDKQGVVHEL